MVVIVTTGIVLATYAVTGSWATGAVAGGIAGGITVAAYPAVFGRRRRTP